MKVRPITFRAACSFIADHHRHNKPPAGHRFSIALFDVCDLFDVDEVIGVVVVGRPVARHLDDGVTAEVTRLCVVDRAQKGACSMLYRAAWRAWKEMGGQKMVTYTLQSESGASLRGAGWIQDAKLSGATGAAWTNRVGREDQAVVRQAKYRWSVGII